MSIFKRQKKSVNRFMATALCVTMMLEGAGMQTLAAAMPVGTENIVESSVLNTNVESNGEDTEIGTGDGEEAVIASGVYRGMDWKIDSDGNLTISGEYDETEGGSSWYGYVTTSVKTAKVTATGVTDTYGWFQGMTSMVSIDLSGFDTSQVTNMGGMFSGCSSLTSLDLSNFNTSQVTDMGSMFYSCTALETLDLSSFDTSMVTDMGWMFRGCTALTSLDLSNFDTSMVTDMGGMFTDCTALTSLDVSNFNTSMLTSMYGMFYNCEALEILDVSSFDTRNVTNMGGMFNNCTALETLDLSNFNTSQLTYMEGMFYNCTALTSLDLSNFDTRNVMNMGGMFYNCTALETLDLSGFDMSKVQKAGSLLSGCYSLAEIKTPKNLQLEVSLPDLFKTNDGVMIEYLPQNMAESIVVTGIREDENVFEYGKTMGMNWIIYTDGTLTIFGEYDEFWNDDHACEEWLDSDYVEHIKKAKVTATGVTNTESWFENLESLVEVDLSEFDTSQVTDMSYMFYGCSSLTTLDVSGFNTSQVTDMRCMFCGCSSLTSLDLSKFDMVKVEDADRMISGCLKLDTIYTPINLNLSVPLKCKFADENGKEYVNLPQNLTESIVLTKSEDVVASGTYRGVDWIIDNNGELTVSGDYNAEIESSGEHWNNYAETITKATITATNVRSTSSWFWGAVNLKEVDFSKFDTSQVTSMSGMFLNCSSLTTLDLSNFETGQVTNMGMMFCGCSGLTTLDVSNFDTSQVLDMTQMFQGCSNLTKLDVSNFNTSQVCEMGGMFGGCKGLSALDVSKFDTSQVIYMWSMFNGCSGLTSLDVSNFDTSQVTDMSKMFRNCSNLTMLDMSNFDMQCSSETDGERVLDGCTKLREIKTPKNLSYEITLPHAFTNPAGEELTCLPMNLEESMILTANVSTPGTEDGDDTPTPGTEDGDDKPTPGTEDGDDKPTPGTEDGNDKPTLGTEDGDDKPISGTEDGEDKPAPGTEDGDDKPAPGTEDGDDKPAPGTEDGDDKTEDEILHDEIIGEFKVSFVRNHVYTGKVITPKVIVTFGADKLVEGVDYTVSYKNNVNAATVGSAKAPVIIVKGKGNYDSSATLEFNIHELEMTAKNTSVSEMIFAQNNKEQTVKPVVTAAGKKLKAGKDYTIEYPDKDKVDGAYKDAGTYNIIIKGCGNYQGSVNTTMMILGDGQIMASKLKVAKIPAYDYVEGTPATPTPDVMNKKDKLELGKDYAISYINNDRAGKATLVITGLKNTDANGTFVAGTLKKTFTIKGTALKKARAEYNNKVNYTGSVICPEIALTYDGKTLRPGIDYTVKYTNNVNVGKGTILLTGQGGYTGTVKKTFAIQADASIADKLAINFVNGKAEASFNQKGAKPVVSVVLGDVTLKAGKDYTVSYKNNKKLAAANAEKAPIVIIKGKGNYKFTKEVPFAIVEKALTDADMSIISADLFVGSKKGYLSVPVVKDGNGKKLKVNKDYKVLGYTVNGAVFEGTSEVVAGTVVTVTVEGMGNYKGQTQIAYRIANNDISKVKVNKPQLEYNGGKVTFTEEMLKADKLKLTDKATGKTLVYGTDFVVVGYKNNTKKGNATVTVQGIGEYGGTKAVKFKIMSKKIAKQ